MSKMLVLPTAAVAEWNTQDDTLKFPSTGSINAGEMASFLSFFIIAQFKMTD